MPSSSCAIAPDHAEPSTHVVTREQDSLSSKAASALSDEILSGRLRPGERIDLGRYAALWNVSVTPLRDAAKHYFGRSYWAASPRSFAQCGHLLGGGRTKRSRMACLMAGRLGCGGGPPILLFPSRGLEAAGLEEGVGDHGHQGVPV